MPPRSGSRTGPAERPRHVRRFVGLLALLAVCWATVLVLTPEFEGEPTLVSTSPAEAEVVRSPEEVRLTFDRAVPAELATVRMTKPSGEQVVHDRPYNPSGASDTIAVPMPETRYVGTYSVAWAVPSSGPDQIRGTFTFSVAFPSDPVRVPKIRTGHDPIVAAAHIGFRLLAAAAFTLGAGLILGCALLWPSGLGRATVRRLITYSWWALLGGTLGTIATFGGYTARTSAADAFDPALLSGTLDSEIGGALLVRLLVLVPITIALALWLLTGTAGGNRTRHWSTPACAFGATAALAATWSFARPDDPDGPSPVTLGAGIVLLLATAVAVGALVSVRILARDGADSVTVPTMRSLAVAASVGGALVASTAPIVADGWWERGALFGLAAVILGAGVVGAGLVRNGRLGQAPPDAKRPARAEARQ